MGFYSHGVVHTPNTSSYSSLLQSSIRNTRFLSSSNSRPLLIVAPTNYSQIQASVICCKKHDTQVRVRSGGHDFEGLSYTSHNPFVLIDLSRLRYISVNEDDGTAWVQAGATLGEVYHSIAEKSSIHGFPAGYCHTVGVGGHLSGGGTGNMVRMYGLAADNILDAKIIDVNGRLLDRRSMGEDLFWALRGGGGASFGVILSWKIKLVYVPPAVTLCNIAKNREEGATELVYKWQKIADKLHERIYLAVTLQAANVADTTKQMTIRASFRALALWGVNKSLPLIQNSFPELGLEPKHCTEMSWIDSVFPFAGLPDGSPRNALLDRSRSPVQPAYKIKYDYVKEIIPKNAMEEAWKILMEDPNGMMIWDPMGGRMSEISDSEIPFPHRKGNRYNIQYLFTWQSDEDEERQLGWIRKLYNYLSPYVSKSPRGQYINCKDLDLGKNDPDKPSYPQSKVWGEKYFGVNFRRLALVKGKIDPENFFRNEQSIPPL
ncbi:tetrahydroberberine oxidase-like [Aristolochia californica]|uniref:tetrahydroberberine oxidase-like n=1 Tax=Aristolochia californica TaxID=171875 RepID=UPI0035DC6C54